MNVQLTILEDKITLVTLRGELDGNTTPPILDIITPIIIPQVRIILQMQKVEFMSSAGLRMMLILYRQINEKKGDMVLVNLPENIAEVMAMTGFLRHFTTFDSIDAGIQFFKHSPTNS
jgi:anti-sigma B factor antagonist